MRRDPLSFVGILLIRLIPSVVVCVVFPRDQDKSPSEMSDHNESDDSANNPKVHFTFLPRTEIDRTKTGRPC
jgi:hypothetical protein